MDEMERLMCNFHYLGYYCSPYLSIHRNSTQELTWNFLVTFDKTFSDLNFCKFQNSILTFQINSNEFSRDVRLQYRA